MSSVLDKLNLRPQERRMVAIVSVIVFVALNLWLVIPQFGEFGKIQQRTRDSSAKLKQFQEEIGKQNTYNKELLELQNNGQAVATEEQALRLQQEVLTTAALTGVSPGNSQARAASGRTNSFFDEQSLSISISGGEKQLIDFLYALGSRESLTRVKSMTLSPDPSRMSLRAELTLTKSFQRRSAPRPAAAAPAAPVAAKITNSPPPTKTAASKPPTNKPPVKPSSTTKAPAKASGSSKPNVLPSAKGTNITKKS